VGWREGMHSDRLVELKQNKTKTKNKNKNKNKNKKQKNNVLVLYFVGITAVGV
jgi:hypothetical protein